MKKHFILVFLILTLLPCNILYAQQNTVASGQDATSINGSVSYTIGQIDFSAKGFNNEVLEGLQQPYEIISLGTDNISGTKNHIIIYPNPVNDILFVDFNNEKYEDASYILFDAQGRIIKQQTLNNNKNQLDFSNLTQSVYIIKIYQKDKNLQTFKIIKK